MPAWSASASAASTVASSAGAGDAQGDGPPVVPFDPGHRGPRNVQVNGRAAIVIDDLVSRDPWTVRGLEIRGTAVALEDVDPPVPFMSREVIRITPTWVTSWGVDPEAPGRRSR